MELTEGLLERDGFNIHYWTGGSTNSPLVVFTHGATIDHHEWDATLPLAAEHFPILTWDMRGHGLSRPAQFSLELAIQDLLDILDRLGVLQAIFVGHSMGGNLHQELVFHHPDRVKALVFVDCTWNFQKLSGAEKMTLSLARPIFKLYPYKTLINQTLEATTSSEEGQALLRPAVESQSKDEIIQIMMATIKCLHEEPGYKIGKPILMILGDHDQTGNIHKVMPIWAQIEPDCRFVVFMNSRHAPNLDEPELFHKELLDFLKSQV